MISCVGVLSITTSAVLVLLAASYVRFAIVTPSLATGCTFAVPVKESL